MTRIMFALSLLILLCSPVGSGLAQEGGWRGVNIALGGSSHDLITGKNTTMPLEARVMSVIADGPAAAAGLKVGDVITSVGERQVQDGKQLVDILRQMQPGSVARMRVKRDGTTLDLDITLGKRPPTIKPKAHLVPHEFTRGADHSVTGMT